MRQETKPAERQAGVDADLLAVTRPAALPAGVSLWETALHRHARLRLFTTFLLFSPPSAPLSVLRHVDGPPGWDRRAPVCDAEHLHGLPLWSPFAVTVQHGRVHPLPGGICGRARGIPKELLRLKQVVSAGCFIFIQTDTSFAHSESKYMADDSCMDKRLVSQWPFHRQNSHLCPSLTYLIPRGKVLVLLTGIPLLTVQ